ncbi:MULTISPECIES: TadE family protein [unclassified Yoonia]|uniref:TadE/TadG family type IV pilus assembly protein n=1 Tax=unclassified Yoonia TaxID=2629118 RepID=UPI002AFDD0E2|nr:MULTISPECIES: TadE family protein [unclassified Yoonia]
MPFWRREDGSVTVEYVLWIPVIMSFMVLITDATMLMHNQSLMFVAARDASRQVALGQKTANEAEEGILARFAKAPNATASVQEANGFVTATIAIPFEDVAIFGGLLSNASIRADVTMWVESNDG